MFDWIKIARDLGGLGDLELDRYLASTLTGGQRAHLREAAMVSGYGRLIAAIDRTDPVARATAETFWSLEQAVITARATNVWHDVATRLAQLGDADIRERARELDRSERVAIREVARDQRVRDAIHWLDGAHGSVRT